MTLSNATNVNAKMHFIGSFEVQDNLIINDPCDSGIFAERINCNTDYPNRIELNCQPGTWYAYHYSGGYKHPIGLLLVEKYYDLDYQSFDLDVLQENGFIFTSLGSIISVTDKNMLENTKYIYFLEKDTLSYRIRDIKLWLKLTNRGNHQLIKKLDELSKQGEHYIDGEELTKYFGSERITVASDLWANDCRFRIINNPLNASPIMGGVISRTFSPCNHCYTDSDNNHRIIYLSLDEEPSDWKPELLITG